MNLMRKPNTGSNSSSLPASAPSLPGRRSHRGGPPRGRSSSSLSSPTSTLLVLAHVHLVVVVLLRASGARVPLRLRLRPKVGRESDPVGFFARGRGLLAAEDGVPVGFRERPVWCS